MTSRTHPTTAGYLEAIGVERLAPATSPFDPGYDPVTLDAHLSQSSHLMATLKISMACWLIADEASTRAKFASAARHGVTSVTGGGPFEIAVAQGALPEYLDLCASVGAVRIEAGSGFTEMTMTPREVIGMAGERGLDVQFELGEKHDGAFTDDTVALLIDVGRDWMDAGARELVIEARESGRGVGLFDMDGQLNAGFAERFVEEFGFDALTFEAPTKPSQFALLDHFGPRVKLSNVRIEELLRVEIYRRGLHSDAFARENLRPRLRTAADTAREAT